MKMLASPEAAHSLAARLRIVDAGTVRRWGRMTAPEMICRLADSFDVAPGGKIVSPATGIFRQTVMKWGALYVPLPWPRGVSRLPEIEQGAGGTPPGEFEQDRSRFAEPIHRFAGSAALTGRAHPIFGPLTTDQWRRLGFLHADHHLRQFGV